MLKKIFKIGIVMLFLMTLFTLIPSNAVFAETVANHQIFSEKTIKKRIAEIKKYYYKQPDKLTKRKVSFGGNILPGGIIKFTYYLKGKDLLFAYGKNDNMEFRLYFHKNQLIQMIYDEKGKKRETYTQLYEELLEDENYLVGDAQIYMEFENLFKKEYSAHFKKPDGTKTIKQVIITDASNKSITYHTCKVYGEYISFDTKAYTAKLSDKVKVKSHYLKPLEDGSRYKKENLDDLKYGIDYLNYVEADLKEKNGKIVEIIIQEGY